jgi:plasmid stabilization system protein ParE
VNSVIRPRARDDIMRQFRWYLVQQDAPEAAFRFLDAVEESIEQLLRMPNMGAPKPLRNPDLEGLRSWPVAGFEDMRIYHLVQNEILKVVRILHGKRDISRILESEPAEDNTRH